VVTPTVPITTKIEAQLEHPSLQKGKLLDLGPALHLVIFPMLVDIGRPVGQALEFHLNHFQGLVCVQKLTLKEGDLPSCLIGLPMNEGQ
jgi:hypothetical protein